VRIEIAQALLELFRKVPQFVISNAVGLPSAMRLIPLPLQPAGHRPVIGIHGRGLVGAYFGVDAEGSGKLPAPLVQPVLDHLP